MHQATRRAIAALSAVAAESPDADTRSAMREQRARAAVEDLITSAWAEPDTDWHDLADVATMALVPRPGRPDSWVQVAGRLDRLVGEMRLGLS